MAVISVGSAAIMSVVTGFGEGAVAGYGAAQRLDKILLLPAQALGTSVNSMAGQNIGVGNWKRVKSIAKYGVIYSFSIMIVLGLLAVFLVEYCIRLFMSEHVSVIFCH